MHACGQRLLRHLLHRVAPLLLPPQHAGQNCQPNVWCCTKHVRCGALLRPLLLRPLLLPPALPRRCPPTLLLPPAELLLPPAPPLLLLLLRAQQSQQ